MGEKRTPRLKDDFLKAYNIWNAVRRLGEIGTQELTKMGYPPEKQL